jgi:hypothetical protein
MRIGRFLRLLGLGAALALGLPLGGAGSALRAEEAPRALSPIRAFASPDAAASVLVPAPLDRAAPDALEGLEPLAPAMLGRMRGGQDAPHRIAPSGVNARIRFWDEIGRPPRPLPPQDGVVSSTSRALR